MKKNKLFGTKSRPRMSVYRSNKDLFVQLIDDQTGKTLLGVSSKKTIRGIKGKTKTEIANLLGEKIAEMARKKKISKVIFEKGGYKYHGRVKALAEGARKGGLHF